MKQNLNFYNMDCIEGAQTHLPDNSVDLIITDPPYGIDGHLLHKHYNRKEEYVIDGYVEVPKSEYPEFTRKWIAQAARVLRPGGTIYIVSGYSNLLSVLSALARSPLVELNHIIWKYNFGVFTKRKFVSSHYHILCYVKPGGRHTFNTFCRYGADERTDNGRSLNYMDREDVWIINREYKPGQRKNKNELPSALLQKMILYSSNEGDLVCDFFLGSFSTARVAIGLNRQACGFEINKAAYEHGLDEIRRLAPGWLLGSVKTAANSGVHRNQGRPWTPETRQCVIRDYERFRQEGKTKRAAIEHLSHMYGRGYFSILNVLRSEGL